MTERQFETNYNVTVNSLNWQTGWNGLYMFANVGPFTVYHDAAWGYYVTRNGSKINQVFNLAKYL